MDNLEKLKEFGDEVFSVFDAAKVLDVRVDEAVEICTTYELLGAIERVTTHGYFYRLT